MSEQTVQTEHIEPTKHIEQPITFPPEVVEVIVDNNLYECSLANRECNQRYRFGVAADYLRGIKVVLRYCLDCDMIYQVGDKIYNMIYNDIPSGQQDDVVQTCQAIYDAVAGDIKHSAFARDPDCTHSKCASIFGFDPVMLAIVRNRAERGDYGLLKYIQYYIPGKTYKLLRETHEDFALGNDPADIEFKFWNLKGRYWQQK